MSSFSSDGISEMVALLIERINALPKEHRERREKAEK